MLAAQAILILCSYRLLIVQSLLCTSGSRPFQFIRQSDNSLTCIINIVTGRILLNVLRITFEELPWICQISLAHNKHKMQHHQQSNCLDTVLLHPAKL